MTDRDNTSFTDHHLVKLTIDDQPIAFTKATITQTTMWSGEQQQRQQSIAWRGEIVSPTYRPAHGPGRRHRLVAETYEGYMLAGYFEIARSDPGTVDITGINALMRLV